MAFVWDAPMGGMTYILVFDLDVGDVVGQFDADGELARS